MCSFCLYEIKFLLGISKIVFPFLHLHIIIHLKINMGEAQMKKHDCLVKNGVEGEVVGQRLAGCV
jgi:hypothetical protein